LKERNFTTGDYVSGVMPSRVKFVRIAPSDFRNPIFIPNPESRRPKTAAVTQARVEEKKKGLRDPTGNWYRKEPYDRRLFPHDDKYHYRAEMRGDELIFTEVTDASYWGGNRGAEKAWFIANRLDGNRLIGIPAAAVEGVVEITDSQDFNEWEFSHSSQYGVARKTYMRK
jgi:hypothetical protein